MKRQDKQVLRWIGVVLALILFLGWFLLWPLNSYVEAPGNATNLRSFVQVKGHPDPGKGSFMITSVALQDSENIMIHGNCVCMQQNRNRKFLW